MELLLKCDEMCEIVDKSQQNITCEVCCKCAYISVSCII